MTGWLKVKSAHHSGDTHSGDWASEIDLVDRNATLQSPESDAAGTTAVYSDAPGGSSGEVSANVDAGCEAVDAAQGGYVNDGCVYRVAQAGSYWSPFLAQESQNGQWGVQGLLDDANAAGVTVVPYDGSQLAKGDTIVFSDGISPAHVGVYDGQGGMWHNSSSHQCWYHASSLDMGSQYPEYIIKTSEA